MHQFDESTDPGILVTIVIPAYNYAKSLRRAAVSVIAQLEKRSELIIIDDGSTDDTPSVIDQLVSEYPESFRSIRQANAGLAAVRNKGLDVAKGCYLIFLDADDEMVPGALSALLDHIEKNPTSQLIIGGHISVHQDGREVEHLPDLLPNTHFDRVRSYLIDKTLRVSNGACAMRKDVFYYGRYPERFRSTEDIPVFAQVFNHCICTRLNRPVARIYKHDDSMRHDVAASVRVGDELIAEVFDSGRLSKEMQPLRKPFTAQRYLSLFRTCVSAGDTQLARRFYRQALASDWRAIFRVSYTRKALRLWLKAEK
jgi:glycosyltransferase involved in cell wall biosynthesis